MAFDGGFICCVNALSWVQGSNLVASETLALGQQSPLTMSMRKCLSILGWQSLCVLCVAVILVLENKGGEHIVCRGLAL